MKTIPVILYTVAIAALAWIVADRLQQPKVITETETVYVDRFITKRDTVTVDRPVTRTIYRTHTDTVYIRMPVPRTDQHFAGLVTTTPIRFSPKHVTLTYWSPDSLTYIQDTYSIPKRNRLYLDAGAACMTTACTADARINATISRLTFHAGYGVIATPDHTVPGFIFGIRSTIIGR